MKPVELLGVNLHPVRSESLLELVEQAIRDRKKSVFAYANVHALNLASRHPWFRDFLNSASVLYTDGEGVRLGAWLLGKQLPERIALTTWVWKLTELCETKGFSMFFLGSSDVVVRKAAEEARNRHPNLSVVGVHHGYFEKNGVDSERIITQINNARPDILLVGFGMPLQEEWIKRNLASIDARVVFTAGSCFEYMAGTRSVCPTWMSNAGLEWLYRLAQEPRRLFVRYVVGNPLFIYRILKERFTHRKREHE